MNNILVTGGAGYIGSHIVEQLVNTKAKIIIIDNLVTGYRKLINNKAIFIKGDVLKTLSKEENLPQQIALLRLDTDWYESTKFEMNVLYPRIIKDGVLLIDDYTDWQGCKKAVDEYFYENFKFNYPLIWGNSMTGKGLVKK